MTTRLDGLRYSMVFQGTTLQVAVADGQLVVEVATEGFSHPVRIGMGGEVHEMGAGDRASVALTDDPAEIPSSAPADDGQVLIGQNGRSEQ